MSEEAPKFVLTFRCPGALQDDLEAATEAAREVISGAGMTPELAFICARAAADIWRRTGEKPSDPAGQNRVWSEAEWAAFDVCMRRGNVLFEALLASHLLLDGEPLMGRELMEASFDVYQRFVRQGWS